MPDRRSFLAATGKPAGVALLCSVAGAAVAPAQAQTGPVRIGFSIAQTGPLGAPSASQRQAYDLWREQVNARGGLENAGQGKRPVEFVVYDDQSQGQNAARIYEKLIGDDKVDLLLAPYATAIHMGIIPVVERARFPILANTIGSIQAKNAGTKYMLFTQPFPDQWAVALIPLIKASGAKRVAVITAQLPFSLDMKKTLIGELKKAGIEPAFNEEYPGDVKDLTSVITGLKAAAPDFVVGLSYLNDSVLYTTQARELGLQVQNQFTLIGPAQASFVQRLGPNADGTISIGQWSRHAKRWPRAAPFFDAYVARWKMPPDDKDTTIAYVSCEILEQAVARAGLDREKLRSALMTGTFDTIMGPAKFDDKGHNAAMPAGFIQIQKGINEVVWPREIATAELIRKPGWQ
ncbi:MAG: amino acid ABC transporter substrate-binding protein [Lautropia sp.]